MGPPYKGRTPGFRRMKQIRLQYPTFQEPSLLELSGRTCPILVPDPSRSHRPSGRHGSAGTIGASSIKSRPGRGLLRSRLRVDEGGEIFADLYPAPFPDAIHDLVDLMHAPARREPVRP